MSWDTLIKDYLIDDSVIIEAAVKITKMHGISKKALKSFEKTNEKFSDVVLSVEDKKFFVLRKFLAFHSTYFEALLLGKFKEADNSEVTLNDINSTDFQNLLELLYGETAIDNDSVDGILHLAHIYDVPVANRKCEEFLLEKSGKSIKDLLKIANQYQLENLTKESLAKINSFDDIKSAVAGDLEEMDPKVVAALLRKAIDFH